MKKVILEIGIDDIKREYMLIDNFKDLPLNDMTGVVGYISAILHNYLHIQGNKQLEYNEKLAKQN